MKNLRKMLAVVSALAVMLAAVPAFADTTASGSFTLPDGSPSAVSANYDDIAADNEITVTVDTSKASVNTEMTFIVLDKDVTDKMILDGDVTAEDILHIDQKTLKSADNSFFARFGRGLVDGELPESETGYPIRVGYYTSDGNFAIASTRMIVSKGSSGTTIEILWGDVNQDGVFNGNDASKIIVGITGGSKTCGDYTLGETMNTILWGDVNQDGVFNGNDASKIIVGITGGSKTCGDFTLGEVSEIVVPAE